MDLKYEAIELPKKAKKPAERKENSRKAKKQVASDAVEAETKSFSLEQEYKINKIELDIEIYKLKSDIKQIRQQKKLLRKEFKLYKEKNKFERLIIEVERE